MRAKRPWYYHKQKAALGVSGISFVGAGLIIGLWKLITQKDHDQLIKEKLRDRIGRDGIVPGGDLDRAR